MTTAQFVLTVGGGFLAAMLGVSGGQKVVSPFPAALALLRFGLAPRIDPVFGRLAGTIEALVAATLVIGPSSPWPFVAAAVLGGVFVAIVARSLAAGKSFPCACVGNRSEPLSAATLLRAGCFLLLAGSLAVLASLTPPVASMAVSLLGVGAGVTLGCIAATVAVLRQVRPFRAGLATAEEA